MYVCMYMLIRMYTVRSLPFVPPISTPLSPPSLLKCMIVCMISSTSWHRSRKRSSLAKRAVV